MNCRQARREIHELPYGTIRGRERLGEHLRDCDACRAEMSRVAKLDAALRDSFGEEPDERDLERITTAILGAVARDPGRVAASSLLSWPRIAAACAGLCLAFAGGGLAGRAVFPREVVRTTVVTVPRTEERIVEVPVQVVKERVVTREVPVLRTEVVYRDSPAAPGLQMVEAPAQAEPEPVKVAEVAFPVQAVVWIHTAPLTYELLPAGEEREHDLGIGSMPQALDPSGVGEAAGDRVEVRLADNAVESR